MAEPEQNDGPYTVEPAQEPCEQCGHHRSGYCVMQDGVARSWHQERDSACAEADESNRAYCLGAEHAQSAAAGTIAQLEDQIAGARAMADELMALIRGATP